MQLETLKKAQRWFESVGYQTIISHGKLYLECDSFSVELSENEVEGRADQWDREQSRED
jgi:hypothetical protein